jgi:hypothetical protein
LVQSFPVLGQSPASIEPCDGALDDPTFRQHDELAHIRPLDDLDVDPAADALQSRLELRPLVTAVSIELEQERIHAEQGAHQQHTAITVLDVGGMDNRVQQKALSIYKDMALLALDLFARIEASRVNRAPPFSALLTLWLSMIAAVGLFSRPAISRHPM